MADQQSIVIFVATHVPFALPANPIYVPLHVGKQGKKDLGYIGDNSGENISDLNPLFGELTGLYWIWQNIVDVDYVGFCHYRRYFLNNQGREMSRTDYLNLLNQFEVLIPRHAHCEGDYFSHYGRAHNAKDLETVGKVLVKLYPECREAFEKAMTGNCFYGGNLMVTSLPILKAYAQWLFTIFAEATEEIDVSTYDNYHKRVYGFLSEQMMYVYLLAYGLTYCEVPVGISQEKAETKALKDALTQMLALGQRDEAKKFLQHSLQERPDLLLPGSDIYGELQKIIQELGVR